MNPDHLPTMLDQPLRPREPHLGSINNDIVSKLAPFSGLILTVTASILALFRIYLFNNSMISKIYSAQTIARMSDGQLRSFINHHVASVTKVLLLVTAGYPFLAIFVGHATPQTPFVKHGTVTLGDVLLVCTQLFTIMYIFELFFRDSISLISFAHHIGAIVIAQAAVAMSINHIGEKGATLEFLLCMIWGAFDVFAELWPHIAMIIYRLRQTNHRLLTNMFWTIMWLELIGTLLETIVVMWLFASLWKHWPMSLKLSTPILHVLFSCAQLWGAIIFRRLAIQHRQLSTSISQEGNNLAEGLPIAVSSRSDKAARTEEGLIGTTQAG